MNLQEPLLTTEDVANFLKVEVVTVRRLVGRGELAAYRVGGEFRFSLADIQDYLKRQYVPSRQAEPGGYYPADVTTWLSALRRLRPNRPQSRDLQGSATGERFTKRAQSALAATQERAERWGSAAIEPAHLLLALSAVPGGLASRALTEFGIDEPHLVNVMTGQPDLSGPQPRDPKAVLKLSNGTMGALRAAVDQANKLKHNYVGTEHLLLGLLADEANSAVKALDALKISTDKLRAHVLNLVKHDTAGE